MTDQLGYRGRIAIVIPSTNTSCQPESERLRPKGVTNHVARISIRERPLTSEQAFLEHVQAMRDGMRSAIDQVMTCQPTHVIMGVALEAFAIVPDGPWAPTGAPTALPTWAPDTTGAAIAKPGVILRCDHM